MAGSRKIRAGKGVRDETYFGTAVRRGIIGGSVDVSADAEGPIGVLWPIRDAGEGVPQVFEYCGASHVVVHGRYLGQGLNGTPQFNGRCHYIAAFRYC